MKQTAATCSNVWTLHGSWAGFFFLLIVTVGTSRITFYFKRINIFDMLKAYTHTVYVCVYKLHVCVHIRYAPAVALLVLMLVKWQKIDMTLQNPPCYSMWCLCNMSLSCWLIHLFMWTCLRWCQSARHSYSDDNNGTSPERLETANSINLDKSPLGQNWKEQHSRYPGN